MIQDFNQFIINESEDKNKYGSTYFNVCDDIEQDIIPDLENKIKTAQEYLKLLKDANKNGTIIQGISMKVGDIIKCTFSNKNELIGQIVEFGIGGFEQNIFPVCVECKKKDLTQKKNIISGLWSKNVEFEIIDNQ
ncbi:MAG: hypothetical protein IKO36_06315 [Bacteroidaceae bacterium]|nr:hypothetical protein [Bacteroidaceae bacterium]